MRTLSFFLIVASLSAAAGYFYAVLTHGDSRLAGATYGVFIGLTVSLVERGILFRRAQDRIRRWPTLLYIAVSEAASVFLVLMGFIFGGTLVWSMGLLRVSFAAAVLPSPQVLLYALVVAAAIVLVTRTRDLLGHEVFNNLLIGRYHKPVEERRIFLFLDLAGSTAFAHKHGDLRAQDYLGAIFAAIAEPVRRHHGAIDDYVGDMALITWPEQRGLKEARCVACVFAILDEFERHADDWRRRFGQVPEFHVALHGGSVVTAEVGVDRHKISYFGDVVNTTARIEALCRQLDARILISADLLGEITTLPPNVRAFSRGAHPMKGHDQRLEVFSLEAGTTATLHALKPQAVSPHAS